MGKSLHKANQSEANGEMDQISIDYRLKLIAFQDELFQSRKKLQDSDKKMAELQMKLNEYVQNKENQIAEVVFTAHMNAQRIEAQTRSQTEYLILEMEDEMRRKQKELEILQKKTNRFVDDTIPDISGEDVGVRLQVVQDNIRAFREQIETTKITDDSLVAEKPVQPLPTKKRRVVRKSEKSIVHKEQSAAAEQVVEIPVEIPDQAEPTSIAGNYFDAEYERYQPESQAEPNERMRLDAFVDARYHNIIAGQKEMQHHALQVTIEVEVPPDNYSVRYTKVSSDVVSTLLQFDNVILNDIFPFNIIEPNPQNIAVYFYNCLEDMLSMMDLVLHSLTVLELPDLQIQVNTRNTKLDNFLHQGDNDLNSIRQSLIPCVEIESDTNSPLKDTFSRILKKRN